MHNLATPANLETTQSVLIREVATFQGWICTVEAYIGTFQSGLNTGLASFQGSRLEWIQCIEYHSGRTKATKAVVMMLFNSFMGQRVLKKVVSAMLKSSDQVQLIVSLLLVYKEQC